jgi:hypothetical protein
MKRIIIASVVMMLLVAIAAQAQTALTPEHKKLGVWVGNWTGEGKSEATPFGGKTGIYKHAVSCAWFAGEYQVVCNGESSESTGKSKGLDIFAYSTEKKQYLNFHVTSLGISDLSFGNVDGSVWTFKNSLTAAGKTYQQRVVFNYTSPNECTVKVDYSEDGKNWKPELEVKDVKK